MSEDKFSSRLMLFHFFTFKLFHFPAFRASQNNSDSDTENSLFRIASSGCRYDQRLDSNKRHGASV